MTMPGLVTMCLFVTCSVMGQSTGQESSGPFTIEFIPLVRRENNVAIIPEESINYLIGVVKIEGTENSSTVQCISPDERFGLVPRTEELYSLETFTRMDREVESTYNVPVSCEAHGTTATLTVAVEVFDLNDNAPVISRPQYNFMVWENNYPGQFIGQIHAIDADSGENARIVYTMQEHPPHIDIDASTGRLILTHSLDREVVSLIRATVVASDTGMHERSSSAVVVIHVKDVNDNAPTPARAEYNFQVIEGSAVGTLVGQIPVYDQDEGANGQVSLSIQATGENGIFAIDQFYVVTAVDLNSSHVGCHNLTVLATDQGHVTLSTQIPVRICVTPLIG